MLQQLSFWQLPKQPIFFYMIVTHFHQLFFLFFDSFFNTSINKFCADLHLMSHKSQLQKQIPITFSHISINYLFFFHCRGSQHSLVKQ